MKKLKIIKYAYGIQLLIMSLNTFTQAPALPSSPPSPASSPPLLLMPLDIWGYFNKRHDRK